MTNSTVPISENDPIHADRMRALVRYTATSFETSQPSPFGAAVYDGTSGDCLAQAYDTVIRDGDPTAHGEVNAIRQATQRRGTLSLEGCLLYSTCEPCPMCFSACLWAEVDTVFYGASTMEDANRYWPQAADLKPERLVEHALRSPACQVFSNLERQACQSLFEEAELARRRMGQPLPPHR